MENPEGVASLFLYFLIYAFIGYLIEIIYCSIVEKRLVNRGFLFGPILPVYGIAMLVMLILTSGLKTHFIAFFFSSILICTTIEYIASWLLERLAGIRWWDYSETEKYHLNGRVSLKTSLLFGFISILITYVIHPYVASFVIWLATFVDIVFLAQICAAILALDIFASSYAVGAIKNNKELRRITGDQTNEIKRLARSAIAQLITGKTLAEQKFATTKKRAQKTLRRTQRNFQKKQRAFKKKLTNMAK